MLLLLRKDRLFCHRSECYGPPSPSISLESIKSLQEMLLPEGREGDLARRATEALYQHGDLQPLVRQAKPGQSSNLKGDCHVKSR